MRRTQRPATTVALFVAIAVMGGCARTAGPDPGRPPAGSTEAPPSTVAASTAPPTHAVGQDHDHSEDDHPATTPLSPDRRAGLGLAAEAEAVASLRPLTEEQWADAEAVAARYVLVDTNYSAGEEPSAVNARRGEYATDRLAADLAASSSAHSGLQALNHEGAVLHGEILGLATSEHSGDTAAVTLTVRRSVTINGQRAASPRIDFFQVTLVRDRTSGHWRVVHVEVS